MRDFNWLDFLIQKRRISVIKGFVPESCRLLDIGCGYYPENLISLKDRVSKAVGIDKEPPRSSPSDKISFVKYDIDKQLPFSNNEFDCVTMLAVLEHLEHPEEVVHECSRVLRPGGVLIITIPSNFSRPLLELLALFRIISREEIKSHLRYFNIEQVTDIVENAGFKVIEKRYYNMVINILIVARKI